MIATRDTLMLDPQDSLAYAESIIATLREPFVVLDKNLRVRTANASFYRDFHVSKEETEGQFVYDLGNGQWNIPKLRTLLNEVLTKTPAIEDFEVEHEFPTIGQRNMLLNARRLGIGLSLVQRLVEMHGGRVEVSSVLGQGSEFVVRLPIANCRLPFEAKEDDTNQKLAIENRKSLRVLVVDDNVDAAESLGLLLKASGHDVRTAYDGSKVLEAALDYRPNVVLLDIGLPGMNGYEVAKQIRQQPALKNSVLVAMTGYGQESDRKSSHEAGFDHHLVKPADFAKLLQILAAVSESLPT